MKTSLSKSRYTKYCQCAKALWLSVNKPEEATIDAGVEARFATSHVADVATMSKELVDKVEKTWSDLMRIIERSGLCDYLLLQAA